MGLSLALTLASGWALTLASGLALTFGLALTLILNRSEHGIGEDNHIAVIEKIAVNPIHYHPVASLQLRRKTSRRHREDSEGKGSHHPHQEQR